MHLVNKIIGRYHVQYPSEPKHANIFLHFSCFHHHSVWIQKAKAIPTFGITARKQHVTIVFTFNITSSLFFLNFVRTHLHNCFLGTLASFKVSILLPVAIAIGVATKESIIGFSSGFQIALINMLK